MTNSPYVPGSSPIHRLDPRIKILLLLEICIVLFWPLHLGWYGAAVLFVSILLTASCGWKGLFTPLKAVLPLLVLVMLLTPLFHRTGTVIWSLGVLSITDSGMLEAMKLVFRFTGLTLSFSLFFVTTPMNRVILTLRWFGLPYTGALVITLSFRYIPTILRLLQHVRDAHRLRDPLAEEHTQRTFFARIRELQPVLTSTVIASIKLIPALAMSLDHRGIGRGVSRTSYRHLPPIRSLRKQLAAACVAAALMGVPLWMQFA